MAFSALVTSPLVFCGIVLTNLAIVAVVALIRRDDRLARGLVIPVAVLCAAVVFRTVMRSTASPEVASWSGRASYMAALAMVPALLAAVTPRGGRALPVAVTSVVALAVWLDPLVFGGTTARMADQAGEAMRVPALSPFSGWLVPYGILAGVAIAWRAARLADEEASWFTAIVLSATVMGSMSVGIVLADLGIVPHMGLEIVAAAVACTLLAHHVLVRSSWQVEELLAATERLERQRRACSDHGRRIARMAALGDAAGQLVTRLEGPARRLDDALAQARGEILAACEAGRCDGEARQAIIDAGAAARRLLRTIVRVHAFASPEVHTSERCHVGPSLRRAVAMLEHVARHQAAIRVIVREDAPVVASPDQLTQLFVVLLRSVLRVAASGPSAEPLTVRTRRRGGRVVVTIAAALGVEARRPAIDPYGDPGVLDDGHGLELATVDRLVAARGGVLRIEGAALTVELPEADGGQR